MQSHTTPGNSPTSDDRRRHVRHKLNLSPTIVVELGPNNGGNLIDIGGGGLSVQAVAKLNPQAELNLHFRLQGMALPLQIPGRVMWLGPTKKVAGISFKNLPGSTEQQIVEWVARQQHPTQDNRPDNPSPDSSTDPDDSPLPLFPTSLHRFSPRERLVLPLDDSLGSPADHSKPIVEHISLSAGGGGLPSKRYVMPKSLWNSPSAGPSSAADRVFVAPEASESESGWRRGKFALAVICIVVGILVLILVVSNLDELGHGAGTTSSQGGGWVDRVRTFFGVEVPRKMDPAKAGVQVWTVQRNGYYYCSGDPNFKSLLPGAIMTQGDAIQSGYQPRLDYCQ